MPLFFLLTRLLCFTLKTHTIKARCVLYIGDLFYVAISRWKRPLRAHKRARCPPRRGGGDLPPICKFEQLLLFSRGVRTFGDMAVQRSAMSAVYNTGWRPVHGRHARCRHIYPLCHVGSAHTIKTGVTRWRLVLHTFCDHATVMKEPSHAGSCWETRMLRKRHRTLA